MGVFSKIKKLGMHRGRKDPLPRKPSILDSSPTSSDGPSEELDLEAFGLSALVQQKQKTCLDHAEAFFAQKDEWKRNHYTMVTTQLAEREIVCPYCNIKGPRFLLLTHHIDLCQREYHRVFVKETTPVEDASTPARKRRRDSLYDKTPETNLKIDPQRCLYYLEKHRGNACQNSQTGMTITTPQTPQLRICDFNHIAIPSERTVVFNNLAQAIEGDGIYTTTEECSQCNESSGVIMKVTVGKRFGSLGKKARAPVRELFFCSVTCFSDYVVPLNNHRWNELVKGWVKQRAAEEEAEASVGIED